MLRDDQLVIINHVEEKKDPNYKDYTNLRPVVPQRLELNTHGVYTTTLNDILSPFCAPEGSTWVIT